MAFIEMALVLIILPLVGALIAGGGTGRKLLWALMSGMMAMVGVSVGSVIGAIIGSGIACLVAALTRPSSQPAHMERLQTQANTVAPPRPTKVCPFCAEDVHADAKKCKHCGEFFTAVSRD
jgi:hypothetical protein